MKNVKKFLSTILFGLLVSGSALAQSKSDVISNDGNSIEVGAAALSNGNQGMEAILHISTNVTSEGNKSDGYYVIVRMQADGSITEGNFSYVDLSMNALGWGIATDEAVYNGFIEATLLNINYKRNLAIDLDHQMTISLVGIRLGGSVEVTDNVKILAETALDFASLGMSSKRASDAASLSHEGYNAGVNARISVAVEMFKKVRIELGIKGSTVAGKGVQYYTGTVTCNTYTDGYYDSWGYYHSSTQTRCYNDTAIDYQQTWKQKELYLSFVAKITENLKAFGKASYNVYSVSDRTATVANSSNNGWMFMIGASYTIPYKK
ncbi:MAG: hypothetical protein ACOYL6_11300 [Bacteriovoracaceae bacterium]